MPMQVFEFQADATVSLASPAAINRKSCDHCFLNRKTCDKVRQSADSGEKCRRCAKDNRPCTFTPTVHLYHIADCVGRHQCRAKVLQAMGGNRKKEVQYKTIEIPLVCDMDSPLDQALFDFIQRQPNLLVYNNRIKSFLAQDMLGITPDCEDVSSFLGQTAQSQAPSSLSLSTESAPYHGASIFNNNSGPVNSAPLSTSGPSRYGPMSMTEHPQAQPVSYQLQPQQHQQHSQHQRPHPYAQHQKTSSEDRGRRSPRSPHSPMGGAVFNYHHATRPTEPSAAAAVVSISGGRVSPIPSPHTLGPMDTAHYLQRRPSSEALAAATAMVASASATSSLANANLPNNHAYVEILQQQQQQHPYARQSPYPMAFTQQQQQQQQQYGGYRVSNSYPPSPLAPSPLAPSPVQNSPVPPSPLELSLSISTNFGVSPNSHQNLPSLFDTSLNMSSATNAQSSQVQMLQQQQQQHQYHHHRQLSASSISSPLTIQQDNHNPLQIGNCGNAMGDITMDMGSNVATSAPAPLVITTTDDKGDEVGFYYAVPSVSLNPGCTDSDLFQDFPMIDPLGESFVWIENLFDEKLTGEVKTEMTLADEIQGCRPPSDIFVQDRDVQDDEDEEEDDALMAAHGLLGTATAMTGPVSINMTSILQHPHHHSLYNIAEYLAAPPKTEPQFGDLIPAQTLQG